MDQAASGPAAGLPDPTGRTGDRSADPGPPDGPPPSRRRRARSVRVVAVVAVVASFALGAGTFHLLADRGPTPVTRADLDRAVQQGVQRAQQQQRSAPPDAARAYRTILPSLVTIETLPVGGGPAELGAGVVVNADGAVMTALHVVATAGPGARIRVRFADGTAATATVSTRQPANDVAVLAVDTLPQVVTPAVLGGGAQVGDAVFPVGHPLGLADTLTAGVVSALGRSVRAENGGTLTGLIQFDAAVNPGNSGGPLLDRDGQVIGIVTGLVNPSSQKYFVGIGFAVPIAAAGGGAGLPQR